jgi:group I intron endonuclease
MYGIIYTITNRQNGKQYVGQTTWLLRKRWSEHVAFAKKKEKSPYLLYEAIRKYGRDAFDVQQIDTGDSLKELNEKEMMWIARLKTFGFNTGYNMTEGGKCCRHLNKRGCTHPMFGKHHSEETRAKMRAGWSEDRRLKFQNWSTNRIVSQVTRKKISAASKSRKQSAETISKRVQKITGDLHPNAKTYRVTSPDGLEYVVKSLRHFCAEHGLNVQSMANTVRRGTPIKSGPYKGWMAQHV